MLQTFREACSNATGAIADFLFPMNCTLCGGSLHSDGDARTAGSALYCGDCREKLCPEIPFQCPRCGARTGPYTQPQKDCVHCRRKDLRFKSVVCLAMYEGAMRTAVLSAKWSYSGSGVRTLAAMLVERRRQLLEALPADLVIPVPHHWRQRLVRHFNPAWLVAEELGRRLSIPCDVHILRRRRLARPQKRVAVSRRFENQSGSFAVRDAHVLAGQNVLLVDDVLTTGATCSEAAAVLKTAGARSVHVAVLARVLDHST